MIDKKIEQVLELFTLNDEQCQAATEVDRDVVVTAGAGSGKTATLVARYSCLLAQGIKPRQIAAVTFTIKAAQEMRSRVRKNLEELQAKAQSPEDRQFWTDLSTQIDSARIGTVHSLCAEILRNHPAEAGLDPRFGLIEEGLAVALKAQVVEEEMARLVEDDRFLPLLYNMPVNDLAKLLRQMLQRRLETQETFEIEIDNNARVLRELEARMLSPMITGPINTLRAMDSRERVEDGGPALAEMVTGLLDCWSLAEKALSENDSVQCAINLYNARRKYMALNKGKKTSEIKSTITELRTAFEEIINPMTGGKNATDDLPSSESEALFEQLLPLLRETFDRVHQAYRAHLERKQMLDFDDLEFHAQRLLSIPEIRQRWQQELKAIMVDEYQDTNPRQRDIINALAGNRGCLFLVGDMRQSIYRFRRADVTVFREEQERIKRQNGQPITLNLTYRAHQDLLNATGDLLDDVIGTEEQPTRKYYVPHKRLVAFKKAPEDPVQPPHLEFIVGAGEEAATAKVRAGQALAARLLELKQEGQIQKWSDVAMLFRATTGYAYYEEALEDAGIPFVSVAGRGFYDRPEIRDLLNIMRALADPLDDVSFAGLLRSPAFGLSDAALFQLRQAKLPFFDALRGELCQLSEADQAAARRALAILNKLMPLVDRIPVSELLKRVIDELDYRAILATADISLEHGQSIKAAGRLWRNLDKLLSETQQSQAVNVRDFLEMISTLNDAGAREGEAPAEAEGSVRMMTIHAAKGLQYPVVVLADAGRSTPGSKAKGFLSDDLGITFKLDPPPMLFRLAKHLDGDQNECEDLRVLYVALTRAQSKLMISGHGKINKDGAVILPGWGKAIDQVLGSPSVQFITQDGQPFEVKTRGNYPVRTVCQLETLPSVLNKVEDSAFDLMPDNDLVPIYLPAEGFGQVELPDEPERDLDLQSWRATQEDSRVSGTVLGSIVHKALQRWLFPGDDGLEALLESEAWRAGLATEATRQEITVRAKALLSRFRAHSVWDAVDSALERYAELPYSYLINEKVENRVVDLLYRDHDGWHIIDFKTDPVFSSAQKEQLVQLYAPQVRRYKAIVESKLRIAVSGKLCFLDDQGEISLVEV